MSVVESIDEARQELSSGHDKAAARILTEATYETHDPELTVKIEELARQGRGQAGRFGKGRWDEIIRLAELRGANGTGSNGG